MYYCRGSSLAEQLTLTVCVAVPLITLVGPPLLEAVEATVEIIWHGILGLD